MLKSTRMPYLTFKIVSLDYRLHVEKLDHCKFKITGRDRYIVIEFGPKQYWEVVEGHISDKYAAILGDQCIRWANPNFEEENK